MRALWSDRPNCSHNVSQKVKRIKRLSESWLLWGWCADCGVRLLPFLAEREVEVQIVVSIALHCAQTLEVDVGISLAIYRSQRGLSLENSEKKKKKTLKRGCRGLSAPGVNVLKKKWKTSGKPEQN